MNREEAKLILEAYRPGGQDAGDPFFAEALALARQDAELGSWFAQQQTFDSQISGSLKQVRVPSRPKAEILAMGNKTTSPATAWWQNIFSWQSPVAWSAAVVVVVVLSLALFQEKSAAIAGFADYSAQMVNTAVNDRHHVDIGASDMKQAVAWLSAHQGEQNLTLPAELSGDKAVTGCRVMSWHGQNVSMLCFMVKGTAHVDVFIAEAGIFADAPPVDHPQFSVAGGLPTASWTHDGKAYLAVSHGDTAILKSILSAEKFTQAGRSFDPAIRED